MRAGADPPAQPARRLRAGADPPAQPARSTRPGRSLWHARACAPAASPRPSAAARRPGPPPPPPPPRARRNALLLHQLTAALIQRPECLIGGNGRADLVVVPRVLGLRRLLDL